MKDRSIGSSPAEELTENERKIITSLVRSGELTKKALAAACGVGWATVVKMVDRLVSRGWAEKGGTAKDAPGAGKNAYVYRLTDAVPCAVGIDVEYHRTKIVVSDIAGTVLRREYYPTPVQPKTSGLVDFLVASLRSVTAAEGRRADRIVGVVVGDGVGLNEAGVGPDPGGAVVIGQAALSFIAAAVAPIRHVRIAEKMVEGLVQFDRSAQWVF